MPSAGGEVRGHLEVEHVAGVVLDDVQDAGAAVDRLGRLEHLVGRRRREDLARTCGVEHPAPDETAVHGLMSGAAAGDDADLALHRRVRPHDDFRVVDDPYQVPVSGLHALQRLADDGVGVIDELLHRASSPRGGKWATYRRSIGNLSAQACDALPHGSRDARLPVLRPSTGSRHVLRGMRAQSRGGRAPPDGAGADRTGPGESGDGDPRLLDALDAAGIPRPWRSSAASGGRSAARRN